MEAHDVINDALDRHLDQVPALVDGLGVDDLAWRPDAAANSIAWLLWHLTRVTDDHVADVADTDQVWTGGGWAERFDLPFAVGQHGYGHTPEQVAQVRVAGSLLVGYHAAVAGEVRAYVAGLTADDLDRVVDSRWDPPVTLGARLVSVVNEVAAHVGQAQYVRGLLERR